MPMYEFIDYFPGDMGDRCLKCKEEIRPGEFVEFTTGVVHLDCDNPEKQDLGKMKV